MGWGGARAWGFIPPHPPPRTPLPYSGGAERMGWIMDDSSISVTLDWLQGSFPVENWGWVEDWLSRYVGDFERLDRGMWRYSEAYEAVSAPGALLLRSVREDERGDVEYTRCEAVFCLKGSALALVGPERLCELLGGLPQLRVNVTRLDAACDDYEWVIDPDRLWRDYGRRKRYSGPRSCRVVMDEGGGSGVYFGSKGQVRHGGSGLQLCVYDKNVQSEGRVNACRWEARFYDPKSQVAWAHLVLTDHEGIGVAPTVVQLQERLAELVGGCVEFWDDDRDGQRGSARRRARFWETLRGRLGGARIRPSRERDDRSFERVLGWLKRSAAKSIAIAYRGLINTGKDFESFMRGLAFEGDRRLTTAERRVIPPVPEAEVSDELPF